MILEKVTPPTVKEMQFASGTSKDAAAKWSEYCKACQHRFQIVSKAALKAFGPDLQGKVCLDWGAAVGGVAIIMQHKLPIAMYAADVDSHSIRWLRRTNQQINCSQLLPNQKLPYVDNSFDLIYGIAVLTHIPPKQQEFYLAELSRVCKNGGLVVLTVKSYSCCDDNKKAKRDKALHFQDREVLKKDGIVFRPFAATAIKGKDFGGTYGNTYHSTEYVREVFGRHFFVEAIEEAALMNQDVVTLRKY